eukprot:TRINITY_DN5082_c0_g2_i1.p1 TRINITY_DN5082_c0_g2~~TRINITY_DN5082_c0_g2_i1.p1  ORF type:complete len:718 (+),score=195.03 TRINITY_DN5082_c0_g2_i1:50-2203(+)
MKSFAATSTVVALLVGRAQGAQLVSSSTSSESPVTQIVGLIGELKARIEADGQAEQASYSKYACWCEDTLATKASDITAGKNDIESLQTLIEKLRGELGSHGADIKQLQKDVSANIESQKEATELRRKESATYESEKLEAEQCIGALEAAVRVLAGAGSGGSGAKANLLATFQQAQLLSVAAGIRGVLRTAAASHSLSESDLNVMRRFADRPEDFVGARSSGSFLSAAQIANNPFGDYAPQSTQIQGILKSMYDSFTGDLERMNGEESVKQKSFEDLMATKKAELKTLEATLLQQQTDEATKTKQLADSKTSLDDAKTQLAADEDFFGETKTSCRSKAGEWAERTRLRTEELHGMAKAIEILSSDGAKKTFANATTTLLQLSSHSALKNLGVTASVSTATAAYQKLRVLASVRGSDQLGRIAALLRATGHFDKVISAIDSMIGVLRKEEAEDVAHRDRCQGSQNKNKNTQEDLDYSINKAEKDIQRLRGNANELSTKINAIDADINATTSNIAELVQMRTKEHGDFVQAVKDDANAVDLLNQAIVTLTKFYKSNGLPLALAANGQHAIRQAPPATWSDSYGGRKGESEGIIAILTMIRDDLEMETKVARTDDANAQTAFEKDRASMNSMLKAQKTSKAAAESELAALNMKVADLDEHKDLRGKDLEAAKTEAKALDVDCAWVESHFESRRTKRKTEMDGLVEAKNYLAGVEDGTAIP